MFRVELVTYRLIYLFIISLHCLGCGDHSAELTSKIVEEELKVFRKLVIDSSAYFQLNSARFDSLYDEIYTKLTTQDHIFRRDLTREFDRLLTELGDRHASTQTTQDKYGKAEQNYFLPFSIAPWKGKYILAMERLEANQFRYFLEEYPLLVSIETIDIIKWMNQQYYKNKYAPIHSRHTQNIKQLQEGIDDFLVMYNIEPKSPVSFTFSDIERIRDTTIQLYLSKEEKKWEDRGGKGKMQFREYWTKKYSDLLEWFPNNIAYIALPLMVSKKEEPDYFEWFNEKIQEIQKESKALIIDIRDNPGGSRDLLQYLGNYFISPSRTTYVANIAQLRIDTSDNRDISELIMRGLYSSTSPSFDTSQRTVIKDFNECFKPFKSYDKTKFSDYYYMLLNPNFFSKKDHYDRPIFILINENSFSAASVFAGALKGER
ncbi:MAG: S41 family peptidase, partial [Bacteroidota bacterium]